MDIMNEKDTLILMAPYDDFVAARGDFASLSHQVHQHRFQMREAVLVTKNAEGKPEILETSANHARTGAGSGAGIGVLLGPLIPPSVAVGAFRALAIYVRCCATQQCCRPKGLVR